MPITNNFPIPKEEKKFYPPLPEGIHQCELLDVSVEERPTFDTRNKPDNEKIMENTLKFQFTLLSGKDANGDLRGRNIWVNYVQAMLYIGKNGKNKLYQIVEALIGRELTREEEANFQAEYLNSYIGMQCVIGLKHKKSGENIYDNAEGFYKINTSLPSLTAEEKEKARVKKDEEKAEDIKFTEAKTPAEHMQAGMEKFKQVDANIDDMISSIPF